MTIEIATGHAISFDGSGRAMSSSEDAATWWDSLTLVERAHLFAECAKQGKLNGPDAIGQFRNPS